MKENEKKKERKKLRGSLNVQQCPGGFFFCRRHFPVLFVISAYPSFPSARLQISSVLEFDAVKSTESVYKKLKSYGALDALRHPDLATATMEILPDGTMEHSPSRSTDHHGAFACKSKMAVCMRTHTGEKPYACTDHHLITCTLSNVWKLSSNKL